MSDKPEWEADIDTAFDTHFPVGHAKAKKELRALVGVVVDKLVATVRQAGQEGYRQGVLAERKAAGIKKEAEKRPPLIVVPGGGRMIQ
jgi:hypothetical protein